MSFGHVLETMVEVLHINKMVSDSMSGAESSLEISATIVPCRLCVKPIGLLMQNQSNKILGRNNSSLDLVHCCGIHPH
jgi:hypothetical protein